MPVLSITACSPRIYRPPALGAEYRFDEGLKPSKHPSHLFDKKMEKDLQKNGMGNKSILKNITTTPKTDAAGKVHTAAADSTTRIPAASPASPDSSHNGPD